MVASKHKLIQNPLTLILSKWKQIWLSESSMLTHFINLHFELLKFNSGPIDKNDKSRETIWKFNIQFQFKTNVHFIITDDPSVWWLQKLNDPTNYGYTSTSYNKNSNVVKIKT